ncbi:MAG TPA: tetratricopeptide repeat protein, partial [Segetibacter sp.]|nr:tetratricopeptide repeat protein [Segetibacter sp.]
MELTDKQYDQVLRYVDDEMDAIERKAFEVVLKQNIIFQNEVKLYKELRSIFESAEQKICINKDTFEEKTPDPVSRMIKQARLKWEINHENDWKQKYSTLLTEAKNIQGQKHDDLIDINDEAELGSEKGNFKQPLKEEHKVKRIYSSQWLAATVLTGFVLIAVTFQYLRNKNIDPGIVYDNKEANSKVAIENKNQESQKKNNIPDTTSYQVNSSASDNASSHNNAVQKRISVEKAEREKLVAKNFKRDDLPSQIPDPLEDPSASYKDNKAEDAIEGFKKVLAEIKGAENLDIVVRGDDDKLELIKFYAHYYLAQSYMSRNNAINAVRELEKAIKIAPDARWENKVQWYLALAYLKTGQIQRAKTLLKEVVNNDKANNYKQKAIKLLKELQ